MLNNKDIFFNFFLLGYIDPGTGSMLISALIASLSVIFYILKDKIYSLLNPRGSKGRRLDPNRHYELVYYSEGKQYWNVFKPLLEEGAARAIKAVYLTSDKEDPGLQSQIEGVEAIYIGTGREAYYNLNRLNANLVVMTTPGLDVLEIKRSKNVKHYAHITHATSSSATYKAFGTDYYDSVLVGGEGTFELIKELEEARELKPKEIEVIGHTYLDALRENIKAKGYEYTYFNERRKTILISPTWGDHGLLTKYGKEILAVLEQSNKYNVIIRPHPQSFISDKDIINYLMKTFPNTDQRVWDTERENLKSMAHADIMLSDFSGIIFDYYTLFKKPILTMKSQYEKRGREAMYLKENPWDLQLIDKIGATLQEDDLNKLVEIIDNTIETYSKIDLSNKEVNKTIDKYPDESAVRGVNFIEKTLKALSAKSEAAKESEQKTAYLNEDYTFNPAGGKNKPWLLKLLAAVFDTGFLLQIILAFILFMLYRFLGAMLVPPGINQDLLQIRSRELQLLLFGLCSAFLFIVFVFKKGQIKYKKGYEKASLPDLLFALLPITPIAPYIFANQDILTLNDSLVLFGIFSLISVAAVFILPLILSPLIAKLFTMPITSVFLYTLFNMSNAGQIITGHIIVKRRWLLILSLMLVAVAVFLSFIKQKKILFTVFIIFFISNSVLSFNSMLKNRNSEIVSVSSNKVFEHTSDMQKKSSPDVFIMIYDSYTNQETVEAYGYDNSEQMNFLLDNGFAIYDGSYSVGAHSTQSMSQVLHMEPLQNQIEFRRHIAGEASGLKFFNSEGYNTYLLHENDYCFRGFMPKYDTVFPAIDTSIAGYKIISGAILEGEFRFDAAFSNVTRKDFLKAKETFLSQDLPASKFIYNHTIIPNHCPMTGVLLPDETKKYTVRLEKANAEMRKDINDIKSQKRDAIIIIAGDHGPYLTKNGTTLGKQYDISEVDRLDIQARFGAFLAIHWPEPSYAKKHNIKTIQDVLPATISYMYGEDDLFDKLKMSNTVNDSSVISGAGIDNGIIVGGKDDGKPLFENVGVRLKEDNPE